MVICRRPEDEDNCCCSRLRKALIDPMILINGHWNGIPIIPQVFFYLAQTVHLLLKIPNFGYISPEAMVGGRWSIQLVSALVFNSPRPAGRSRYPPLPSRFDSTPGFSPSQASPSTGVLNTWKTVMTMRNGNVGGQYCNQYFLTRVPTAQRICRSRQRTD